MSTWAFQAPYSVQSPYFAYILLIVLIVLTGTIVRRRGAHPLRILAVPGMAAVIIILAFAARTGIQAYVNNDPAWEYFGMNSKVWSMSADELKRTAAQFEKIYYLPLLRQSLDEFIDHAFTFQAAALMLSLLDAAVYAFQRKRGYRYSAARPGASAICLTALLLLCMADRAFCLTPQLFKADWDPRYERMFIENYYEKRTIQLPGGAVAYDPYAVVSIGYATEELGEYMLYTSESGVPVYDKPDGAVETRLYQLSYNDVSHYIAPSEQKGWRYITLPDCEGFVRTDELLRAFSGGQGSAAKNLYFRVQIMKRDRAAYNESQWRFPTYDLMKSYYPFEYFVLIPAIALLAILWVYELKSKKI